MAHTVQRGSASGKRKAPPSSSDPPTPSPKKKTKVATARKSTGGREPPKRNSGIQPEGCKHVSVLCYSTWMLTSHIHRRCSSKKTTISPRYSGVARNPKVSEKYRPLDSKATIFTPRELEPTHWLFYKSNSQQVREITSEMTTDTNFKDSANLRWQSSALLALQEATEAYLVHLFEDA